MNKKIIFSAGGTGGHIFPAINLMNHFFEKGYEVVIVTDKRGKNFIKKYPKFKSYELRMASPTNKNFFNKILSFVIIFYSFLRSIAILKKEKANLIIGFGGYASFPTSLASKFANLPLVIYEPNIVLGRSNKYLISIAKKIFLAKNIKLNFPQKNQDKFCVVGSIIDKNIMNYSNLKNNNKENFSILVLGGSQGAEIFGKIIPPVIIKIKNMGYGIEINQQCIKDQKKLIIDYYNKNGVKNYVFEFEKNILALISSVDIAITRSGASATAELAHTLTPFIAIPLPNSIDNHQYLNAKFYEDNGCCWLLNENNFSEENLFNLVIDIIKDKKKLEIKKTNMKKNYKSDVYNIIEREIKEII